MKRPRRKGIAIIMALVIMSVLTVILTVVTLQIISQRKVVRQRHRQLQAVWLARAGVELAAARLLEKPAAFSDENRDLVPDAKVRIVVEKAEKDSYLVTAEAEVGLKEGPTVSRTVSMRFRRSDSGGVVRLHALDNLSLKR